MKLRKNLKLYIAISLLALALCTAIFSVVYARYVKDEASKGNQVLAENFYFTTSIHEDGEPANGEVTIPVYGSATISFDVRNYTDTLHITKKDIHYNITFENEKNVDNVDLPSNETNKTLTGGSRDSDTYTITFPNHEENQEGAKVTVTITSFDDDTDLNDSTYVKTMKIVFELHTYTNDVQYYVENIENSNRTMLIIMANKETDAGSIVVDWAAINNETNGGNILQVDCTETYLLDSENGTTVKTKLGLEAQTALMNTNGYADRVIIQQKLKPMQSLAILFYEVPPLNNLSMNLTLEDDDQDNPTPATKVEINKDEDKYQYRITLTEKQ